MSNIKRDSNQQDFKIVASILSNPKKLSPHQVVDGVRETQREVGLNFNYII